MTFLEILLPVIAVFLLIVAWLFYVVKYGHRTDLLVVLVLVITGMFSFLVYQYDANMGYAITKPLPEKFRFLGFTQHDGIAYVWLVAEGSNNPRTYNIGKLNEKEQEQLRKARQQVKDGMMVEGKKPGNRPGDDEIDSPRFHLNIVDPRDVLKKD